jgi:UDP:flavonoid glycosyltransferase YjiC (YdhE family)
VLACGAGVRVRKNVSPDKLRRVIVRALTDAALKQHAEQMADALATDGALAVAERVEQLGCRG